MVLSSIVTFLNSPAAPMLFSNIAGAIDLGKDIIDLLDGDPLKSKNDPSNGAVGRYFADRKIDEQERAQIRQLIGTPKRKNYRYFKEKKLQCPCCGANEMQDDFVILLDLARHIASIPFYENSAYRCTKHNQKVGGEKNSAHLTGWAMDIGCTNSTSRAKIINALKLVGFNRFGIYKNFIHVDCDPSKPVDIIWVGN